MHGLTVARINWEYRKRVDPKPKNRRAGKRGFSRWIAQVVIDLQRLNRARENRNSGRPDPIIRQYLDNPDLIWRGTSTTIGAEVELALAERIRLGITSLRPYDVPWRVCRRLTKLARNSRKKLRARDKRRAAGIRPLSESLSRTKPWLAEGIGRSTWFARRRNAAKTELDDCVPPPSETRDAAHSSPIEFDGGAGTRLERDVMTPVAHDHSKTTAVSGHLARTPSTADRLAPSKPDQRDEGRPTTPELPETEPKPNHFRGETMEQLQDSELKDAVRIKTQFKSDRSISLIDRARGYWGTILPAFGIDQKYLGKKHGPCPMCGGTDRWRYQDYRGEGSWWCNGCGRGDGVALAIKVSGMSYAEVARRIDQIVGTNPIQIRREVPRSSNRDALRALWQHGRPIEPDDPVDRYLTGRGITIRDYPRCLRFVRQAKHADGTVHPAMLAAVSDTDGKAATIHKTYLTVDGQKAAVDRVRLFCPGPRPEGGAVRLASHGAELGIAEGIETALAASQLHGVPVWAALDAGGLERFIPPPEVKRLVVFGDNDANFAGHKAAYCLAMRAILVLKIKVEVKIPDRAGTDWNDVLRGVQP